MARKGRRRQPKRDATRRVIESSAPTEVPDELEISWTTSHSGAIASRGFHFQDVVGAWLCARLLAGELEVERVVPEGHEDLSCEGGENWQVQVKSRQARRGDFTESDVATFVLDVAARRREQEALGVGGRSVLLLERPVSGWWGSGWGVPLARADGAAPLIAAIKTVGTRRGLNKSAVEDAVTSVSVTVVPWHVAAEHASSVISSRFELPPAATVPVVLAMRDRVAACSDRNASSDLAGRESLDRTSLGRLVNEAVALVDREALEEAITSGACEPIDFDTPLEAPHFYEGVDVQPGHIAAGLPAPRPVVTESVVVALSEGRAVLVTGPSGVGKSTVMWAAAYCTRHVLWYRVRRLREADVEPLVRLAKAAGASTRSPVGFVVDAVGVGAAEAWDQLKRELDVVPGALLLGSARTEDLLPLRTLADMHVVDVHLDEEAAAQIHAGLRASGLDVPPHWRDAFEKSAGLTMEFTHLLSKGRRLRDVLSEQVNRRVSEDRETELRVIALVTTAHRWSANLTLEAIQQQVGGAAGSFRGALKRLRDEHLVVVDGDRLTGLHQLRSRFLCDAVHAAPPPTESASIGSVLLSLDDHDVRPFVIGVLDERSDLDEKVVALLVDVVRSRRSAAVLGSALHSLRFVDFAREARVWASVLDAHGVVPALRPLAVQFGLSRAELGDYFRPEIIAAAEELRERDTPYGVREAFIHELGADVIGSVLASADDLRDVTTVLAACASGSSALQSGVVDALLTEGFVELLVASTAEEFGNLMAVSRDWSPDMADALFEAAGGLDAVAAKLRLHSPYIMSVDLVEEAGDPVPVVRLMHLSDTAIRDIDAYVRKLASVVLRCFPACDQVDVQALLAGGTPIAVGDLTLGHSLLQRRNDHPPTSVAWNRIRSQVAVSAAGVTDPTTRSVAVRDLVIRTDAYLTDLLSGWCTGRLGGATLARLEEQRTAIRLQADRLFLPVNLQDLATASVVDGPAASNNDQTHLLVSGVIGNLTGRLLKPQPDWRSLTAYVGGQLLQSAAKVRRSEQWDLSGAPAPLELERLEQQLRDLHAILAELAWGELSSSRMQMVANHGPRDHALAGAANAARAAAQSRLDAVVKQLEATAGQQGLRLSVVTRADKDAEGATWPPFSVAVTTEIETVADWGQALPVIVELLRSEAIRIWQQREILIAPLVKGRPARALTYVLQNSLWPAPNALDSWSSELGPLHPTPAYDAISACRMALQGLSGLAELRHRGGDGMLELEVYAAEEMERLNGALAAMRDVEAGEATEVVEALIDEVALLNDRVQAEIDGSGSEVPLAVGIASATKEESANDAEVMGLMLHLCLMCDIAPHEALAAWRSRD